MDNDHAVNDRQNDETTLEAPKKKRSKGKIIFLCIFLPIVIILLGITVFLAYPLFQDPWKETFDRLLFDTEIMESFDAAFENAGMEIDATVNIPDPQTNITFLGTYNGSGEYAGPDAMGVLELGINNQYTGLKKTSLQIGWNKDKVLIASGSEDRKSVCIEISRADPEGELSKSVLNPKRGSAYALPEQQYEELLETVKLLKYDGVDRDKELKESLANIKRKISEAVDAKNEYKLFDGGFHISKKTIYKLDTDTALKIIDIVIAEAEESEILNEQIPTDTIYGLFRLEADTPAETTVEALKYVKESLEEADIFLEFSYTAARGRITDIDYTYDYKNGLDEASAESNTDISYYIDYAVFESTSTVNDNYETHTNTVKLENDYNESSKETTISLRSTEDRKTNVCTLSYDHESKAYSVCISGSGDPIELGGVFTFDPKAGKLTCTVDKIAFQKVNMTSDSTFVSLTLSASTEIPEIPIGTSLSEMKYAEIERFSNDLVGMLGAFLKIFA